MRVLMLAVLLAGLVSCDPPEPPTKPLEIKWREVKVPHGLMWRGEDPETGALIYFSNAGPVGVVYRPR